MTDDINPIEWITTKEAADLIEYDVSRIRRLVREGLVRGIKRGRDWDIVMNYVLERMFCMPKVQTGPVRGVLVTQCSLLGAKSR